MSEQKMREELIQARNTLDGLRHPTRRPRNGREWKEALEQAMGVAGLAVDRIDRALK